MGLSNLSANLTNIHNTNSLPEGPSIATLTTLFLSLIGSQDWLKFFLIGGILETCRRVAFQAWHNIVDSFSVTVEFEDGDGSYAWMMFWLSQHPTWVEARKVAVSTSSLGPETSSVRDEGVKGDRKVRFVLAYNHMSTFWYKRRYVRTVRSKIEGYHPRQTLHISILGGSHKIVQDLLAEAREYWEKAKEEHISVYASNIRNEWRFITSRPKRPLKSIILDAGVKENILEDALNFLESKEWYLERGIPFRRGYLLYGAPGSGKTSLIQSIAGELNLDVYIISLSRLGLDDNALQELISDLPEHCIALMEDIDAAFHHTLSRDLPDEGEAPEGSQSPNNHASKKRQLNGISLSGLLNALDGVGAQEGRLLFATTNKYEALDPALRRPGRMDVHVEFGLASRYQIGELFKRFYLPTPRTPIAQRSLSKDPSALEDEDSDLQGSDFGCSAQVEPETEKLVDIEPPAGAQDQSLATIARQMKSDVKVPPEELDGLVDRFRELVPENKFSMAALQGYFLMHRNQPYRAVDCAGKWVEEEITKEKLRGTAAKEGQD